MALFLVSRNIYFLGFYGILTYLPINQIMFLLSLLNNQFLFHI